MIGPNVAATFRSPDAPPSKPRFWRKGNRLAASTYSGGAHSVTVRSAEGRPLFAGGHVATLAVTRLRETAEREGVDLWAYTFMPDHLHLLVYCSEEAPLSRFTKRFKQVTSFHHKREEGSQLWQKSYYDHALRKDEDVDEVAPYIAANPLRQGLVATWSDYPLTGGSLLTGLANGDLKVAATPSGNSGREL